MLPGGKLTRITGQGLGNGDAIAHAEAENGAPVPLGRSAESADSAALPVFLASDQACSATGVTRPTDGGLMECPQ
jgi:NAD(P)-dependent dehydrogenase (short-subunit alcohol dehydrogenase family)